MVALLLIGLGWVVGWSPLLAVQEVRVQGATSVPAEQVRAAAGVELGTPLARVSADAVVARVGAIPAVGSVEVRYGWPHVLVLVVTERVPAAYVAVAGARFQVLDAGGVAFRSTSTRPAGLAELTAAGAARAAALQVLTELPVALSGLVRQVQAGSADDVVLTLADRTVIRWGGVGLPERKAAVASALLAQRPRVIDVSAPELPTTRGTARG